VIEHLWKLSRIPPIDLMAEMLLPYDSLSETALELCGAYDRFLGLLSDPARRSHLEKLSQAEAATDETYEFVRSLGHVFQRGLTRLFLEENETGVFELTKIYGVF
jgi:hypothetical protein